MAAYPLFDARLIGFLLLFAVSVGTAVAKDWRLGVVGAVCSA
jgi:hypothetical protein